MEVTVLQLCRGWRVRVVVDNDPPAAASLGRLERQDSPQDVDIDSVCWDCDVDSQLLEQLYEAIFNCGSCSIEIESPSYPSRASSTWTQIHWLEET